MTFARRPHLILPIAVALVALAACAPPPSAPSSSQGVQTTSAGSGKARAPTGKYRTPSRYRSYDRSPYWRYGGSVAGGVIVGAVAISRSA